MGKIWSGGDGIVVSGMVEIGGFGSEVENKNVLQKLKQILGRLYTYLQKIKPSIDGRHQMLDAEAKK